MTNENIAAISTGLATGGVAVIRISGDSPLTVAKKVFVPNGKTLVENFSPNRMYVGEVLADGFTDYGMCVYFKAPFSFTGEDVVELHIHGGIAITKGVLSAVLKAGARLATNGEFTKRAFLNGKLSLSSAEGLIDMINSESASGVRAGYYLYRENLVNKVKQIQDLLLDALSEIDVDVDFPEEDLTEVSLANVERLTKSAKEQIDLLLSTYRKGRVLKDGVKVGIVGKPNTGKSSTLNALLNYEKAIVSDLAGTTRDVVEGCLDINGVRFYLSDTAGIRNTGDKIEELGVNLSKRIADQSDLVLFIVDANDVTQEDELIYNQIKDKNHLFVVNKIDKNNFKDDRAHVYLSALTKNGIEQLKQAVYSKTVEDGIDLNGDFLCEERHHQALSRASEKLGNAIVAMGNVPLDLLAIDLKEGWDALGEISGKTATEEIINNIFSKFCVGK